MAKGQGALQLSKLAEMSELGIEFQPTALVIRTDITYRHFERIGALLGNISDASKWWIGDWLLFGDDLFGEKMAQAQEATGRAFHTLQNYRWVSSKVAMPRRHAQVSHSAHAEVAALPPEEQERWLEQTEENDWSVQELRAAIRSTAQDQDGNGGAPAEPAWSVEPDPQRVVEIGRRLVAEAQPTGDGQYLVSGEIVAQLRAAFGEGE